MKFLSPRWRAVSWLGLFLALDSGSMLEPAHAAGPKLNLAPPKRRPPSLGISGVATSRKVFALTFDDGPDPRWTPQVLAILKKRNVPATFFMVGQMVRAHPQMALQVKAGHYPIGNHTWSHPLHPGAPQSEVERTDAILHAVLGIKPTLFRPPYGVLDNGLAKVALARGEDVVVWSCHGSDWDKHATAQGIAAKVLRKARPGGIVLLHDAGGNRSQTVAALPLIIDGLQKRGYRLVTVPELLTMGTFLHEPVLPPSKTHARNAPR